MVVVLGGVLGWWLFAYINMEVVVEVADLKDCLVFISDYCVKGDGPPGYRAVHRTLFCTDGIAKVTFQSIALPALFSGRTAAFKSKVMVTPLSELLYLSRDDLVEAAAQKWDVICKMPWELLGGDNRPQSKGVHQPQKNLSPSGSLGDPCPPRFFTNPRPF